MLQPLGPDGVSSSGAHSLYAIELEGLWHRFAARSSGSLWTMQGIDLRLERGELVGLLGPSGCGKTTLLRLIAGFDWPERGVIRLAGREVAGPTHCLAPERRGVGMVFQDYALFPHLTAWSNVCFGLKRRQNNDRAAWLLNLLGLSELAQRYPHELSGGQRQRLALARALAPEPAVVLLDEPFSNLDVEVRLRLRSELPTVLAQCGTSGLLVTHDPEEALAICDRVAVLHDGRLHQCASPQQLVNQPATSFVGRFVLQGNVLPAWWQGSDLHTLLGPVPTLSPSSFQRLSGREASLEVLVSPNDIELDADDSGAAKVMGREFLGHTWLYQVEQGNVRLRVRRPMDLPLQIGQHCALRLRPAAVVSTFPADSSLQPTLVTS
jgi:iron(III) transport system ATP-binding protein